MSDNTHPAVAKFRQEGVHEWQSEEGLTDATNIAAILDAQVEATLALAYEQRTANLLMLWANPETTLMDLKTGRQRSINVGTEVIETVLQELLNRLGLES